MFLCPVCGHYHHPGTKHIVPFKRRLRPRLLVIGHARHGKDSLCESLARQFGLSFVSSSWFVGLRAVWPALRERHAYVTFEQCYADRAEHRAEWHDLIAAYNEGDPARLARELFSEHDIYCGLRSLIELSAMRADGLIDAVIWIERAGLPAEPYSSMKLNSGDADFWIQNSGTLEDLDIRAAVVYGKILTARAQR